MTDSCPSCCRRGIPPAAVRRRGDAVVHGYICATCGHRWATSRHVPAYHPQRESEARAAA